MSSMTPIRRRKPQRTYPSPSSGSSSPWTHLQAQPMPVASSSKTQTTPAQESSMNAKKPRFKRSTALSLPLYHPRGQLALSLPPLDPTLFGFPADVCIDDEDVERRVPVVVETVLETPSISAIAAAADREVKDAHGVAPRKRRGGKRKRKDPDEADATYPAKKTRPSRGASSTSHVHELSHVHEPSPLAETHCAETAELPVITQSPNTCEDPSAAISQPLTPTTIHTLVQDLNVQLGRTSARSSSKEEGEISDQ